MQNLGAALRNARKQKKITLVALAEKSGLSASFISKIERGMSMPSFNALQKICRVLNISSAELIDGQGLTALESTSVQIFRERDRQLVYDYSNVVRFENILTYSPKISLEALTISGSRKEYSYTQHPHDEFGIVARGTLVVTIDDNDYELKEGDSILIKSGVMHKVQKKSEGECVSYWVAIKNAV